MTQELSGDDVQPAHQSQLAAMGWSLRSVLGRGTSAVVLAVEVLGSAASWPLMYDLQLASIRPPQSLVLKLYRAGDRFSQQALDEAAVLTALRRNEATAAIVPQFYGMVSLFDPVQMVLGLERLTCTVEPLLSASDAAVYRPTLLPSMALRMARQVVEAVAAVHCAGWAHGDVKPSNMMWCAETGRIKLVDFGLSHKVSQEGDKRALDCCGVGRVIELLFCSARTEDAVDSSVLEISDAVTEPAMQAAAADVVEKLLHGAEFGYSLNNAYTHKLFDGCERPGDGRFITDVCLLPTRFLLLLNVLSQEDGATELQDVLDDVTTECEPFGRVLRVTLRSYADDQRAIVLEFELSDQCQRAQLALNGRTFDSRIVQAWFCWPLPLAGS